MLGKLLVQTLKLLVIHLESDKFESWADKNHQSGIKWREMSKEEQARYNAEAAAINKGEIMVDQNKEAQKLIHRMFDIVRHFKRN